MDTRLLSAAVLAAALTTSSTASAGASKHQVESFAGLKNHVMELNAPTATLVVMDDDDTLTMMPCPTESEPLRCQYLGGPAWFAWQQDLLNTESPYRVANDFNELLDISTLLFAMNNMVYTESAVPAVLSSLASKGVRLLVETARGVDTSSATADQFAKLDADGLPAQSFQQLIADNSLVMDSANNASLPSPFTPCNIPGARDVSYQQGVMFVSGQNKGNMLKCLLQNYDNSMSVAPALPIRNIVFIDDTPENVEDVYKAFQHQQRYTVKALHYNALEAHKAALTSGPNSQRFQENAKLRWDAINTVMQKHLQSPITDDINNPAYQRVSNVE